MTDDPIRQLFSWVPISAELLRAPTEDEAAEMRARAEAAEQERRNQLREHRDLLAATQGLRRAILEMHGPVTSRCLGQVCEGCESSGYESEPPEWPCRTYELARDMDL